MQQIQQNIPPTPLRIVTKGSRHHPDASSYTKTMLETFGFVGDFTLTTNYCNRGKPATHGIRVMSENIAGVKLAIQPHLTGDIYESYLASATMNPTNLAREISTKLSGKGKKFFRVEDWKNSARIVPFPKPKAPIPVVVVEPVTPEKIAEQHGALYGYSKDSGTIALMIEGIYEVHGQNWIDFRAFHKCMVSKCDQKAQPQGSAHIRKALVAKGYLESQGSDLVRVSDEAIAFAEQSLNVTIRKSKAIVSVPVLVPAATAVVVSKPLQVTVSTPQTPTASTPRFNIKARITELKEMVTKREGAKLRHGLLRDEAALKEAEIKNHRMALKKAEEELGSICIKGREVEAILKDPDLLAAENELMEIQEALKS